VDPVTLEEYVLKLTRQAYTAAADATAAAKTLADAEAAKVAGLAMRTRETSVRVSQNGDKVTLTVRSSDPALLREVLRHSKERQLAEALAKEVKRVRAGSGS
jgi:hypothetical protein